MDELIRARAERDAAFGEFVSESAKATKHSLKAKAASHRYKLAAAEVSALERDFLSMPILAEGSQR